MKPRADDKSHETKQTIKKQGSAVPTKLGAKLEDGHSDLTDSISGSYGDESDDYVGMENYKEYKLHVQEQFNQQNDKIVQLKEIIEN